VSTHGIAIVFGVVLLYSAFTSFARKSDQSQGGADRLASKLELLEPTRPNGLTPYCAERVPLGFA